MEISQWVTKAKQRQANYTVEWAHEPMSTYAHKAFKNGPSGGTCERRGGVQRGIANQVLVYLPIKEDTQSQELRNPRRFGLVSLNQSTNQISCVSKGLTAKTAPAKSALDNFAKPSQNSFMQLGIHAINPSAF